MRTVAAIQVRLGSTRLPGKVLKEISNRPILGHLVRRLRKCRNLDDIVVSTSLLPENDPIALFCEQEGLHCYRGSEEDVLGRMLECLQAANANTGVVVFGDCPLIDPGLVDDTIKIFKETDADFTNVQPPFFPDGLDVSVFSFNALEITWKLATTKYDREHVDSFIMTRRQFKKTKLKSEGDYSGARWTLDVPEDYEVISSIIEHFSPSLDFTWKDILELYKSHPEYFDSVIKSLRLSLMSAPLRPYVLIVPGSIL